MDATVHTGFRFAPRQSATWLCRLFENKAFLVVLCMLPTVGLLVTFLTYPLGLGVWLSLTDTTIGQPGEYIGLDNFISLFDDPVFWGAVWYTVFYTAVATVGKFLLGLWLALLLNHNIPWKAFIRAIVLLPWIVPTVLSAIAWWWIYDPQFSIVSYVLVDVLHWKSHYIDFLGTPWHARWSLIVANIWRGIPFVAITLLAGLQTISPSLYEAALLDGANGWQKFRRITVPLLMPILSVALTLSVLFTFSDFQLVYAITRGGPFNSTHLMATLAFQRAIPGSQLGEGAAIAVAMIPFLIVATLLCFFGVGRRKWQQGSGND
jgi:multiple sugar transport system permease protein